MTLAIRALAFSTALTVALSIATAGSQVSSSRTVTGRILDQRNQTSVAGAAIELSPERLKQASDSGGYFRFASVAYGTHEISIRRLGYREFRQRLDVSEASAPNLVISLEALPLELREVRIAGRVVSFPARFEEPYKRAASARGFYFTHDDIKSIDAYDYQALFNRIPRIESAMTNC